MVWGCISCACDNVISMAKMIQIRNVPDDLHRRLKVRAASEGSTLSDYLLREVNAIADKPTLAELTARLRQQEPVDLGARTAAEWVRAGRPDD